MFTELNFGQSRRDLHLSESKESLKDGSWKSKSEISFSVPDRGFNFKRERKNNVGYYPPAYFKKAHSPCGIPSRQNNNEKKKFRDTLLFGRRGPMRKPETPVCAAYLCSFSTEGHRKKKTENNIEKFFRYFFFFVIFFFAEKIPARFLSRNSPRSKRSFRQCSLAWRGRGDVHKVMDYVDFFLKCGESPCFVICLSVRVAGFG